MPVNPTLDTYLMIALSIIWGVVVALHTVHPIFSVLLVFMLWSISTGALAAFEANDRDIKYAALWLSFRVGILAVALAALAYYEAGWQGVFGAMLQVANMLDSALIAAIATGLVTRHLRPAISSYS